MTKIKNYVMQYPFSGFEEFVFPNINEIVYVIGIEQKKKFYPFYVGESTRHIGRIGSYLAANKKAKTSWRVGTAIKILQEKGYVVKFKYSITNSRADDEKAIMKELQKDFLLLNEQGYSLEKEMLDFVSRVINQFEKR